MHLSIVHDANGNIVSAVASPENSGVLSLGLAPGQYLTEIDAPELSSIADEAEVTRRLADIVNEHRIDGDATSERRLVSKSK